MHIAFAQNSYWGHDAYTELLVGADSAWAKMRNFILQNPKIKSWKWKNSDSATQYKAAKAAHELRRTAATAENDRRAQEERNRSNQPAGWLGRVEVPEAWSASDYIGHYAGWTPVSPIRGGYTEKLYVFTSTQHGYANEDYVILNIDGSYTTTDANGRETDSDWIPNPTVDPFPNDGIATEDYRYWRLRTDADSPWNAMSTKKIFNLYHYQSAKNIDNNSHRQLIRRLGGIKDGFNSPEVGTPDPWLSSNGQSGHYSKPINFKTLKLFFPYNEATGEIMTIEEGELQ